jgi:hypothetical protein
VISTTALRLAGPGIHLAARPHGVLHLTQTPPGRRIPRSGGRAVCHTRTRTLYRVDDPNPLDPSSRRLCRRCAAVVLARPAAAQTPPTTRHGWATQYADLTVPDLTVDARMAETADEIDRVQYLTLLLHGPAGLTTVRPHIAAARTRVGCWDPDVVKHHARVREAVEHCARTAKGNRKTLYDAREAAIARLGYINATE